MNDHDADDQTPADEANNLYAAMLSHFKGQTYLVTLMATTTLLRHAILCIQHEEACSARDKRILKKFDRALLLLGDQFGFCSLGDMPTPKHTM